MIKPDPVTILLVDDQPAKLLSLKVILEELGETIVTATSAREAFGQLLRHNSIAVVVLDVVMPGQDGFELATMIREHPRFKSLAIIFVSAIQMADPDLLRGYAVGAVDYVPVPVMPELFRAKVRVFVDLYRKTRDLETLNAELERRVTERTLALAAAANMLRRSAKAAGFANFDISDDLIQVSDNFRELWELPATANCNHPDLLSRVHPQDRAELTRKWTEVANQGGSYQIEFRVIRSDGSERWLQERGEVLPGDVGRSSRIVGVHLDVTVRRQADERQRLLMREVDHRSKNALAVVQSVIRLTEADTFDDFVSIVEGRVAALARAHTLLSDDQWSGAALMALVQDEVEAFSGGVRVRMSGPPTRLIASAVQPFTMVIHELATNAAKYGALSQPSGNVSINWQLREEIGVLEFIWVETGGPTIKYPPNHRGFGSTLISANVEVALGGKITEEWKSDGLSLSLTINADLIEHSKTGELMSLNETIKMEASD